MAKPRISIGTNEVTIETPAPTPAPVEKKTTPKPKAKTKTARKTKDVKTPLQVSNEIAAELPPMPVEDEGEERMDGVTVETPPETSILSGLSDEDRQEVVRLLREAVSLIEQVRQELSE